MTEPLRTDDLQGDILHAYDGIEEADNRLPNWWLMTFYLAIAFAAAYWFVFHMFELAPGPRAAYVEAQLAALDKGGPVTDEEIATLATDPNMVSAGSKVFARTCVSCHGDDGSGKIGPNLTDDHWLHGGSPSAIHTTIARGVDGKGMQAWQPQLGGGPVKQVAAYVVSLRGRNLPGKAPEGERWSPAPAAAPAPERAAP
jgi:cytochrome c oxidase cbb3-type subunit 3